MKELLALAERFVVAAERIAAALEKSGPVETTVKVEATSPVDVPTEDLVAEMTRRLNGAKTA